jgi:hypothetical protein
VTLDPEPVIIDEECEETDGLLAELRQLGMLGQMWTLTVVVFCAARAWVIWPTLRRYDIDPWWFLVLDVGTAPTYGLGQAMGVKILRDERKPMKSAMPWIGMLMVSFLAPYLYVLASAGHLPAYVVLGVLLWMLLFGGLGAYRMAKEVRMEPVG